ncbi:MAG: DUF805 domain-containing protein [Ancalomicrobiaceae bacterium]|nr:DUF805 domain-containing protein [Ancalomicrobiaceae bacterium]
MSYALLPFKRIFDYRGRSRRKEYWHFVALFLIIYVITSSLDVAFDLGGSLAVSAQDRTYSFSIVGGLIADFWTIVVVAPGLALHIRRLHDSDRSGWWILITLIPALGWVFSIFLMCLDGSSGTNRFGPSPKVA